MNDLKKGFYRHFKGGIYKVCDIAADCNDSNKEVVVYSSVKTGKMWVRDKTDWLSLPAWENCKKSVPRFQYIGSIWSKPHLVLCWYVFKIYRKLLCMGLSW